MVGRTRAGGRLPVRQGQLAGPSGGRRRVVEAGRALCYVVSGEPWLQWTQIDVGVHVVADRRNGDDLDALLADCEQDHFGPRVYGRLTTSAAVA